VGELGLAFRALRRSPAFTITAALTIALGIGAATAIFSVTEAVLLRPLPYKDPDRLVVLYADLLARNDIGSSFSNENFADIRNGTRSSFEDMATVVTGRAVLPRDDGTPEQVRFAQVTVTFFKVMGAQMALGRDFQDDDGLPQAPPAPGTDPAAAPPPLPGMIILSHEFWQRRYGGDSDVIGRNIAAAGPGGLEVVGVLAPGFELLFPPIDGVERTPDVWLASRAPYDNANRNAYGMHPVGRLKPGVTPAQAEAAVEVVTADIRRDFVIYGTADFHARVVPMHQTLVAGVRPAILALMGSVVFLLLIACANVANLLLVRASVRSTELAVRAALGAGRWRLIWQLLAEALVVAALGTAGGLALAEMGIRALVAIAPANLPRLDTIHIDPAVLLFAALAGLVSAALFGTAPAWGGFRVDASQMLRGSSRTAGLHGGGLFRGALVVAEVTLSFVLLVGSGLMVRSFLALQQIDAGFDPHGLVTFQLAGGRPGPPPQRQATMRQLREAFEAMPGVERVTASTPFPLTGGFSTIRWGLEEALADNSKYQAVDWQIVLPGYFQTMRTRLLEGRTFTDADNAPDQMVVVVDQQLAAKAFPRESAVGKRILIRIRTPEPEWVDVIGVVAHQRVTSLADPGREQVYFADGFMNYGRARRWALRVTGDPAGYGDVVRATAARIDPQFLVQELRPMDEVVWSAQADTRFSLLLIGTFAVVAALLVSVGLYGVLSTVVRQRTAEIGMRMALGASPVGILRLILGYGLRLSAAGVGLGLVAAFALTGLMTTMLVGVTPTDPLTFLGVAAVFLLIAAASVGLPAWRAAALDPSEALREG